MTNWPLFCILSRNKEKKSGVDGSQKASLLSFDDKLYLCFSRKRFFFQRRGQFYVSDISHFPSKTKGDRPYLACGMGFSDTCQEKACFLVLFTGCRVAAKPILAPFHRIGFSPFSLTKFEERKASDVHTMNLARNEQTPIYSLL